MGREGKWMIREYRAGRVTERSKFWVPEQTKARSRRKAASTARKRDANDRDAVKRLARIINANYAPGDLWVTLTWSDKALAAAGDSPEHQAELYIRRIVRKLGNDVRWLSVDSNMDTSGEPVRLHHHILLPSAALELVRREWKHGMVDIRTLRNQPDYTPLAVYLLKQVRYKPDAKKWRASRNMAKPVITESICARAGEVSTPAGALVLARGAYEEGQGDSYVRYVRKCDIGPLREERGEDVLPQPEVTKVTGQRGRGGARASDI